MVSESLLTEEMRALVGKEGAPVEVSISPSILRRAHDTFVGGRMPNVPAVGERIPAYALGALGSDSESLSVPSVMAGSLLISNEWSVERPILMGETLTARPRIADISERFGGRFGYSINVRTEVEFRDKGGSVVANSSTTLMQFDPSGGNE